MKEKLTELSLKITDIFRNHRKLTICSGVLLVIGLGYFIVEGNGNYPAKNDIPSARTPAEPVPSGSERLSSFAPAQPSISAADPLSPDGDGPESPAPSPTTPSKDEVVAFMENFIKQWLNTSQSPSQWLQNLTPLSSQQLAAGFRTTDLSRIPKASVVELEVISLDGYSASAKAKLSNDLVIFINMAKTNAESPWLISTFEPVT